ncbi:TonB-dependent receptor [Sphingomonas sp. MG17]|uniref:TonB-dependent receptor n=1 Tax=Sphingomonas tagetis TaxID=2949092 RepID=A0A9X2KJW2_9SPHN|nr:TonB-dependent receptor [Sphingomonas tagetis]MCP3729894.1 TonB-dependent receptor [Sphingomonas tagetis]
MAYNIGRSLYAGVALAVLAATAPAQAQDESAAAQSDEGAIIVTARKRAENLIDVPLAVTVATQEQLARDQVYNVNDLQRVAPALEISQTSGGETNGGGRLRGLGTGVFNPSVASSVALVIDQVPVGNLNFPLLYDLAQVEVLRGPQGTLFGQGASAGVLNITTRKPSFDKIAVNGSVDFADKGTAGSEVGELVLNAGFNVPLGQNVALRFSSQYKKETGLQRSATTGKDNEITDFGLRGKLLFEPSDALSITLTGEYGKEKTDGQTFFAIAIAPNSTTPFGAPGGTLGGTSTGAYTSATGCKMPVISARAEWYCEAAPTQMDIEFMTASALIDLELSDSLSLTSVTGYRDRRFDQSSRDFSRILPQPAARQERTREDSDQFSQELRLNYTASGFDLVTGVFYNKYTFDRQPMGAAPYTYGSRLPGQRIGFSVCAYDGSFCPVPPSLTDENTSNRVLAAFADATVKLGAQVELFGGLRLDDYKNTTRTQTLGATTGAASTFVTTDSNVSGRIGVSFKPNADTNLFASYSRGYKPPAVGTDPSGVLFELKPESANAFELGAKFGVGRLQLSANAFYSELLNFQSQTSVFVGTALISRPLNIPKITSKGFELNAFGQIAPGFNINAGYQYNDIKFPAGYLGDDGGQLGGTQFLNAPKHKFTLSGDYGFALSEGLELFVNANMVYKSSVLLATRADPRYRYPAHEIINGGIGVRAPDGGWTASLFVRNLTKEREPTAYLASTFAGQADGGIRAWPVAGLTARVVGVRVGFDF